MKSNLTRLQELKTSYHQYVCNYKQFLKLRGFGEHDNDWPFVKRGFLECWTQSGFHRFWQTWNPGIGYFAYKIYLSCGGRDRRNIATIAAFLINGLVHNLIVSLILWRWDFPLPFTFTLFGLLTIVSRWLDDHLNIRNWPKSLHFAINVSLVILSFDFGFRMNDLLQAILFDGSLP